jgi:hypothetical protein
MNMTVLLDLVVAALLIATLYYCFRLDKRLRAFRSGHDGLREVVQHLDAATENARASIESLRMAAGEAGEQLEKRVRGAQALVDELKVIVESGNNLANRLEARLTGASRAKAEPRIAAPAENEAAANVTPMRAPAREERILRALREAR